MRVLITQRGYVWKRNEFDESDVARDPFGRFVDTAPAVIAIGDLKQATTSNVEVGTRVIATDTDVDQRMTAIDKRKEDNGRIVVTFERDTTGQTEELRAADLKDWKVLPKDDDRYYRDGDELIKKGVSAQTIHDVRLEQEEERKQAERDLELEEPAGRTPEEIQHALQTERIRPGSLEPLVGMGISNTYTAQLMDGTKVLVKQREPYFSLGERPGIDPTRGLEHMEMAVPIADQLGVRTPRVARRTALELDPTLPTDPDQDEYGVTEMVEGFEDGRELVAKPSLSYEEAHAWMAFDFLIGNTDRHHGQYGLDGNGDPVAIDHDLVFVEGESGGNYFKYVMQEGVDANPDDPPDQIELTDTKMPAELQAKLKEMADDREKWFQMMRELDFTQEQIDDFGNRLGQLASGEVHSTPEFLTEGAFPYAVPVRPPVEPLPELDI